MSTPAIDRIIFDYLVAATGLAAGVQIFRGAYPQEQPDDALAVIWRGGTTETPDRWATPRFQILARSLSQDTALSLIGQVRRALGAQWNVLLASGQVDETVPATPNYQQSIHGVLEASSGFIGFDVKGRYEFSANYQIVAEHLM